VDEDVAAASAAPAGNGDVELAAVVVEQPVELRRRAMAHDGPGAAGQDCGHPVALAGHEVRRNEGVDGLMDSMQAPRRGALLNGIHRET
jgi:hypothetical protein